MELKIAILGTRGVPNNYGGFEHIAGYLAKGLVQRHHQVTVYNSSAHPFRESEWNGVQIVHCYDPENIVGMVGQFVYDLNCIIDARTKQYDIILMLGYTSSSVWGFLYPVNSVVINNMDGLEWQRTKYPRLIRKFLKTAERLAVGASDFQIADSPVIKKYLDNKYGINCKYIAYGADADPVGNPEIIKQFGVAPYRYYLLMARMEPENNVEMILDGYCSAGCDEPFVVIGNTSNRYGKRLVKKYTDNKEIVFTGAIFDENRTRNLTAYCAMYFHGHSVGGTNPSLLDVMAAKVPIAAHRNQFNANLLKDNALYFNSASDVSHLLSVKRNDNGIFARNNYDTVRKEFNWDRIIDQYENYFLDCYGEREYGKQAIKIGKLKYK